MAHRSWFVTLGMALSLSSPVHAQDGVAAQREPGGRGLGMPDAYRSYFKEAAAAERLRNPLERCLAYPNLPDNQWPAAAAAAECHYRFVEPMERGRIRELVAAGEFDTLETTFAGYRSLDASVPKQRGLLHGAFRRFAEPGMRRSALGWADARPQSAYAQTALAYHYVEAAAKARGSKLAADTRGTQWAGMENNLRLALRAAEAARTLDPQLYPIYSRLLNIGLLGSSDPLRAMAMRDGMQLRPSDISLLDAYSKSLFPRWGGSIEALFAFADDLQTRVSDEPLFAALVANARAHPGWILAEAETFEAALETLESAARFGPGDEAIGWAAMAAESLELRWAHALYQSQQVRFRPHETRNVRQLVRALFRLDAIEWLEDVILNGLALHPDDEFLLANLPIVRERLGKVDEAVDEYRAFLAREQSPKAMRQASFYRLARLELYRLMRFPDAVATLERMTSEFPADPRGWIALSDAYRQVGDDSRRNAALRQYLKVGKPRNQRDEETMRSVREYLATQPDPKTDR